MSALVRHAMGATWGGSASANQVAPLGRSNLQLRRRSRLARSTILCAVDRGNGTYLNVGDGYKFLQGNPGQSFIGVPAGGTVFGGGSKWPGFTVQTNFNQPGYAAIIFGTGDQNPYIGDPRIYVASNLSVLAAGYGNTFYCSYIKLLGSVSADFQWIWGRTGISAGEGDPFATWGMVDGKPPNADGTVSCYIMTASGGSQVQTSFGTASVTRLAFNTFVCSTVNTGFGTGTASFYWNGVLAATESVAMVNPNPGNTSETQPQIGGTNHFDTGLSQKNINAIVPLAGFTFAPWTASDAMFFHRNPCDMIERL